MSRAEPGLTPGERRLLAVLAAVQLVVVLDFTLLLSMGPDLVGPLGLRTDQLPLLVGAHTGAAALAGLLGGRWLEGLPRRAGLGGLLLALALAELWATRAVGLGSLLAARVLAGACGGQAGALGLVLLSEGVAERRRGRAVGAVMVANGAAAILGVPALLGVSQAAGWAAPFVGLAVMVAGVAGGVAWALPPGGPGPRAAGPSPLWRGPVRGALLVNLLLVASAFLITANLSAFVQHNVGLPREALPGLYATAGLVALGVVQGAGRAVDRFGSLRVGVVAVGAFAAVVLAFVVWEGGIPATLGFVVLLSAVQSRNVAVRALATRVPREGERGRFMSLHSAAQQLGAAAGALGSAALLETGAGGRLEGLGAVGLLSVGLSALTLPLLGWVEASYREPSHSATSGAA